MAAAHGSGAIGVGEGFTARSATCKLLEVDDALLAAILAPANRGRVAFKGVPGTPVVVTTADATYAVSTVETSNSVFVCRSAQPGGGALELPAAVDDAGGAPTPLVLQAQARVGGSLQVCGRGWAVGARRQAVYPSNANATDLARFSAHAPHSQLTRTLPSLRRLKELLLTWGPYAGPPAAEDVDGTDDNVDGDLSAVVDAEAEEAAAVVTGGYGDDDGDVGMDGGDAGGTATPRSDDYGGDDGPQRALTNYHLSSGAAYAGGDSQMQGGGGSSQSQRARTRAGGVASSSSAAASATASEAAPSSSGSRPRIPGYTLRQLLGDGLMSGAELRAGLVALGAMRLRDNADDPGANSDSSSRPRYVYRLMDEGYAAALLGAAVNEAVLAGMPLDALRPGALADALAGSYPRHAALHVLRLFSTAGVQVGPDASAATDDDAPLCLSFPKVAVAAALALLRSRLPAPSPPGAPLSTGTPVTDGWVPCLELLAAWGPALPAAMVVDTDWASAHAAAPASPAAAAAAASSSSSSSGDEPAYRGVLSLSLLAGHVLRGTSAPSAGRVPQVRYFSVGDLDDDPAKRFKALFAAKPVWTEGASRRWCWCRGAAEAGCGR